MLRLVPRPQETPGRTPRYLHDWFTAKIVLLSHVSDGTMRGQGGKGSFLTRSAEDLDHTVGNHSSRFAVNSLIMLDVVYENIYNVDDSRAHMTRM